MAWRPRNSHAYGNVRKHELTKKRNHESQKDSMSKRPPIDLMTLTTLTTDEAAPMAEATQRSTSSEKPGRGGVSKDKPIEPVRTENLSPLNFKVPPGVSSTLSPLCLEGRIEAQRAAV